VLCASDLSASDEKWNTRSREFFLLNVGFNRSERMFFFYNEPDGIVKPSSTIGASESSLLNGQSTRDWGEHVGPEDPPLRTEGRV